MRCHENNFLSHSGVVVLVLFSSSIENQIRPYLSTIFYCFNYSLVYKPPHEKTVSILQLIPYNRIEEHFVDQMNIPVSAGSIFNFNMDAYNRLGQFETWVRNKLIASPLIHADETGINIGGKRLWLHNASNLNYTLYYPHKKRGQDAINEMGVIPSFSGILCHDHWKPYYRYTCLHYFMQCPPPSRTRCFRKFNFVRIG